MEDYNLMSLLTKNYLEVKKYKGYKVRDSIKNIVLKIGLKLYELTDVKNILLRPKIQFIYIHHVFDDEVFNFEKLILKLMKTNTFITHSDAISRIENNMIDKPYISISSDDGFKNNLNAAKILDKYNIKCCFFINPDSIGLKDFDDIKNYCKNKLNMPPVEFLDWEDILYLKKNGHEIGSHSIGHLNFSKLNERAINDNLIESKQILESKCNKINHFAYPYGRLIDFNKMSYDAVFKTGYSSCSSAIRGCHFPSKTNTKRIIIKRDIVIMDHNFSNIFYFLYKNSYGNDQIFLNPFL